MKLIRLKELIALTGLSKATLMRMERMGQLPRRRKISAQAMGWLSEEIEAWMRSLPVTPKGRSPAAKNNETQDEAAVALPSGRTTKETMPDDNLE